MATYKLLALDMDGTLLNSQKHVLPKTRKAIEDLAASGVPIAFSTGRGLAELDDYLDELSAIRYGSCVSGALVYDFAERRAIFTHTFPTDIALQVLSITRPERPMVQLLTTDTSVAREEDIQNLGAFHMSVYYDLYNNHCTRVDDFAAYIRANEGKICKVNLYHRDAEGRARTRERLQGLPVQMADAEETSLEVSPRGVSKAEGLEKLCEYLGISMNEVVSVGDAENDRLALEAAGLAVAMGNATPGIKQLADAVVADNDHDGIVEVIERFF